MKSIQFEILSLALMLNTVGSLIAILLKAPYTFHNVLLVWSISFVMATVLVVSKALKD